MGFFVPLKDKNGIAITKDFRKIFDESNRKPKQIWVDQGREFMCILINQMTQLKSGSRTLPFQKKFSYLSQ